MSLFQGWLPQILIDQAMTGVLKDYLKHLQIYLADIRRAKGLDVPVSQLHNLKISTNDSSEQEHDESGVESDSEYQDASDSDDFADATDDTFSAAAGPPMVAPVCS